MRSFGGYDVIERRLFEQVIADQKEREGFVDMAAQLLGSQYTIMNALEVASGDSKEVTPDYTRGWRMLLREMRAALAKDPEVFLRHWRNRGALQEALTKREHQIMHLCSIVGVEAEEQLEGRVQLFAKSFWKAR